MLKEGSTEAQIWRITHKVVQFSAHLSAHRNDYPFQTGLKRLFSTRKCLLAYLSRKDVARYHSLLDLLTIRGTGSADMTALVLSQPV